LVTNAGTVSADVVLAGSTTVVIGPADVTLKEGTSTIVYAWGSASANNLKLAVQTISGMHSSPGGVNAGTGGQAAGDGSSIAAIELVAIGAGGGRSARAGADAGVRAAAARRPAGEPFRGSHEPSPWARVAAVLAAILAGGALTAYLVVLAAAAGDASRRLARRGPRAPRPPGRLTRSSRHRIVGRVGPSSVAAAAPATPASRTRPRRPTRVVVTRLGIDMTVEPQGCYRRPDGPAGEPGGGRLVPVRQRSDDPAGATVLAAHVDSKTGIGPFVRLGTARPATRSTCGWDSDRHAYRVTRGRPRRQAELDGDGCSPWPAAALHLVTCTATTCRVGVHPESRRHRGAV
jgi:hypothetical protein